MAIQSSNGSIAKEQARSGGDIAEEFHAACRRVHRLMKSLHTANFNTRMEAKYSHWKYPTRDPLEQPLGEEEAHAEDLYGDDTPLPSEISTDDPMATTHELVFQEIYSTYNDLQRFEKTIEKTKKLSRSQICFLVRRYVRFSMAVDSAVQISEMDSSSNMVAPTLVVELKRVAEELKALEGVFEREADVLRADTATSLCDDCSHEEVKEVEEQNFASPAKVSRRSRLLAAFTW